MDEWESQQSLLPVAPVTPPRLGALKRSGDDLVSDRDAPISRSPALSSHGSPMLSHNPANWGQSSHLLSPRPDRHIHHHQHQQHGPGPRTVTPEPYHQQHSDPHGNGSQHHRDLLHGPDAHGYNGGSGAYLSYGDDGSHHPQPSHHQHAALQSPAQPRSHHASPIIAHASTSANPQGWLSPSVSSHLLSPRPVQSRRSTTPAGEEKSTNNALRHPPLEDQPTNSPQPDLLRTSQIPSGPTASPYGGTYATYSNKAVLKLGSDLNQMAMGWSNEEWTNRRRLIQFFRVQEGNVINATFRPIGQHEFVPSSIVISCIFRDEWNECFVTSVDTIYLLEALVGVRFTVEEKNRIRRNLEGFKPMTVSKSKADSEPFFKLIMGFPNPKPRNIEKDVKVFPWKVLSNALKKIIGKYSATYSAPVDVTPAVHIGPPDDDLNGDTRGPADYPGPSLNGSPVPPVQYAISAPNSPHLDNRYVQAPIPASPHLGERYASASHPPPSPHVGNRFVSQPPHSPANGHRFVPQVHSRPPTPPHGSNDSHHAEQFVHPASPVQAERFSPSHALRPSPTISQGPSHSAGLMSPNFASSARPGTFDFHSMIDSQYAGDHSGVHGTAHAYAHGPPEGYASFTANEDYGVMPSGGGDRLIPPPMNHSRSYSEGPRRPQPQQPMPSGGPVSFSAGATPYGSVDSYGYSDWDGPDNRRSSDGWKSGAPPAVGYVDRRPASTDGHNPRDYDGRTAYNGEQR